MNKYVQQKFCADPECETPGAHIHPIKNVVDLDNALEVEEIMEYKTAARKLFEEEIKRTAATPVMQKERYPGFIPMEPLNADYPGFVPMKLHDVHEEVDLRREWGMLREGLRLPRKGFTVHEVLAADRETLHKMLRGAGRYKTLLVDTD